MTTETRNRTAVVHYTAVIAILRRGGSCRSARTARLAAICVSRSALRTALRVRANSATNDPLWSLAMLGMHRERRPADRSEAPLRRSRSGIPCRSHLALDLRS